MTNGKTTQQKISPQNGTKYKNYYLKERERKLKSFFHMERMGRESL